MNVVMIYFYSKRFRFAPSFNKISILKGSELAELSFKIPYIQLVRKQSKTCYLTLYLIKVNLEYKVRIRGRKLSKITIPIYFRLVLTFSNQKLTFRKSPVLQKQTNSKKIIIFLHDKEIYKVVICDLEPTFVKTRNLTIRLRVFTDFLCFSISVSCDLGKCANQRLKNSLNHRSRFFFTRQ